MNALLAQLVSSPTSGSPLVGSASAPSGSVPGQMIGGDLAFQQELLNASQVMLLQDPSVLGAGFENLTTAALAQSASPEMASLAKTTGEKGNVSLLPTIGTENLIQDIITAPEVAPVTNIGGESTNGAINTNTDEIAALMPQSNPLLADVPLANQAQLPVEGQLIPQEGLAMPENPSVGPEHTALLVASNIQQPSAENHKPVAGVVDVLEDGLPTLPVHDINQPVKDEKIPTMTELQSVALSNSTTAQQAVHEVVKTAPDAFVTKKDLGVEVKLQTQSPSTNGSQNVSSPATVQSSPTGQVVSSRGVAQEGVFESNLVSTVGEKAIGVQDLNTVQSSSTTVTVNAAAAGTPFASLDRQLVTPDSIQVIQTDPANVSKEINVRIQNMAQEGGGKITIQLDPPDLGRVDIKVEFNHEGKAMVVVVADKAETLDLLRSDARSLERSLQDAGLKTDSNSLNFSLKDQNNQQFSQNKALGNYELLSSEEESLIEQVVALENGVGSMVMDGIDIRV